MKYWENDSNQTIYNNMPIHILKNFAKTSCIEKSEDVSSIHKYLNITHSVLEIGAGYGRAIDAILRYGYRHKFTCIERSPNYIQELKSKFKNIDMNIVDCDIKNFTTENNFDLVLFLWAGFAEFNNHEQLKLFEKVSTFTQKGGYFIIDSVYREGGEKNSADHQSTIKTTYGENHRYFPTKQEMHNYACHTNFHMIEIILYTVTTVGKKQKVLYVFHKQ